MEAMATAIMKVLSDNELIGPVIEQHMDDDDRTELHDKIFLAIAEGNVKER